MKNPITEVRICNFRLYQSILAFSLPSSYCDWTILTSHMRASYDWTILTSHMRPMYDVMLLKITVCTHNRWSFMVIIGYVS